MIKSELIAKLAEENPHRVVGRGAPGDAEADLFLLFRKGPEQPVPDDEHHAQVLVDVLGVGAVVDAVVRRGTQDPLQDAEPADVPGVDQDAVELGDGVHQHDVRRPEAE